MEEGRPSDGKMAPTTTIETITVTRPLKVIAFICGLIVVILMIMALSSTDWLMAKGWRQGLFVHCIDEIAPTPLPFGLEDAAGCYRARDVGYIRAGAALCIICLLTDLFATLLTGLGLRSTDPNKKYKYYRIAVWIMGVALISILIALVIYPVYFAKELEKDSDELCDEESTSDPLEAIDSACQEGTIETEELCETEGATNETLHDRCMAFYGNRRVWEFGWAYGIGWGAAIFLFGAVILLLCDKESEEIYYKERTIIHDNDSKA